MELLEKIKFNYETSQNQENLFTKAHVKYDVTIEYNGISYTTEYQTTQNVKKDDVIYCLLMDASSYEFTPNLYDFLREFGYNNDIEQGVHAFEGCKQTFENLNIIFTTEELEKIREELE